ncbi:ClpP/crotonase-like domain-containing protein [Filobasidium floriforme]|uniref:ClpP/crotonase-like domain-containing protein n=1 Tax=Filobasidium floriforme TaxID=5210 RepID=UPI001E8D34FC|nr:ClpP/crotonase-like domain-containing protein [Filobasidium floriforme]KAH8089045.1 ClpP/crotonase-like domain-containing protein [Filobasidium floriforme]
MPLLKVTRPSDLCWQISFDSAPDNRLTDDMFAQLAAAMDQVEYEWRSQNKWEGFFDKKRKGGALILTSEITKFFSNGLDFENSIKNPRFHLDIFSPVAVRLLTFPLVTIAAINGHAFAGGFLLALCCDYRLMTDGKAWCCMNEVDFGAPFPPFFSSLLSTKLRSSPNLLREVSLAKRFTAPELHKAGVVDEIVPTAKLRGRAIEFGNEIGLKSAQGPWGLIKEELYYDCLQHAKRTDGPVMPHIAAKAFFDRVGKKYEGKVEAKL